MFYGINKYIFFVGAIFCSISINAQTIIEDGGNWSDTGNWAGGNVADVVTEDVTTQTGGNPSFSGTEVITVDNDYTVGSITFVDQDLTVSSGFSLVLGNQSQFDSGTKENFTADNNVIITVESTGTMIIWGDLIVKNNVILDIQGDLIIKGDVILKNGGDLTVSGSGSVDIGGNFTGEQNTTITTSGSATLNVDGNLSLGGGNSSISGPDDSISVGGGCSCSGCSGGVCPSGPLPVELALFDVQAHDDSSVKVNWVTATEENNDYFEILRSKDGVDYEVITQVDGAGNSTQTLSYEYIDSNPLFGQSYYRLKQTDYDGQNETFSAKGIYLSGFSDLVFSPNPVEAGETLEVYTGAKEGENVTVTLMNLAGDVVMQRQLHSTETTIKIENNLGRGVYFLKVKSGSNQVVKRLLIK